MNSFLIALLAMAVITIAVAFANEKETSALVEVHTGAYTR